VKDSVPGQGVPELFLSLHQRLYYQQSTGHTWARFQ
jgi:hypothetical protein